MKNFSNVFSLQKDDQSTVVRHGNNVIKPLWKNWSQQRAMQVDDTHEDQDFAQEDHGWKIEKKLISPSPGREHSPADRQGHAGRGNDEKRNVRRFDDWPEKKSEKASDQRQRAD